MVQAFVDRHERLSLVYLPPYAPELNPIELVWAYAQRNVLGNCYLRTVNELRAQLVRAWPQQLTLPIFSALGEGKGVLRS